MSPRGGDRDPSLQAGGLAAPEEGEIRVRGREEAGELGRGLGERRDGYLVQCGRHRVDWGKGERQGVGGNR